MLRRISRAVEAGKRAAAVAGIDAPPTSTAAAFSTIASWALVHFGDSAAVEEKLAAHRNFCRSKGYRCLLVSDRITGSCIGAGDLVFEFAPWPMQMTVSRPGGFPAALDYTFGRLGLIFTFWHVVGSTWSGPGSAELLELAPRQVHPLIRLASQTTAAR